MPLTSDCKNLTKELSEIEIKIGHLAKDRIITTNHYYERIEALQKIMDAKIKVMDQEREILEAKAELLNQELVEAMANKTIVEMGLERCGG